MIANYWPDWFRALYGGAWPTNYCAIDIETSGFAHDRDVIVEWGHCLVQDNEVVDQLSLVLDWTDHPTVPMHWLENKLRHVHNSMEMAGKRYHHSIARMRAEGIRPPEKGLKFIRDFTETLRKKQTLFVAHNAGFEEGMICANFMGFGIAPGFTFGDNGYLDTGAIEKASQCVNNPRMFPRKGDTLKKYFQRVLNSRVEGVKWNLENYCFDRYQFGTKHGVNKAEMHGAMMDAYGCHLLMQEYHTVVTPPQTSPMFPDADHKEMRKTGAPIPPPAAVVSEKRMRGQRRS